MRSRSTLSAGEERWAGTSSSRHVAVLRQEAAFLGCAESRRFHSCSTGRVRREPQARRYKAARMAGCGWRRWVTGGVTCNSRSMWPARPCRPRRRSATIAVRAFARSKRRNHSSATRCRLASRMLAPARQCSTRPSWRMTGSASAMPRWRSTRCPETASSRPCLLPCRRQRWWPPCATIAGVRRWRSSFIASGSSICSTVLPASGGIFMPRRRAGRRPRSGPRVVAGPMPSRSTLP